MSTKITSRQVKLSEETVEKIKNGSNQVVIIEVYNTMFEKKLDVSVDVEEMQATEIEGEYIDYECTVEHYLKEIPGDVINNDEAAEDMADKHDYKNCLVIGLY